ncbi:MAG: AAA family ATPase, partial [Candidatus Eremiobacterota bacterium]
RALQELIDKILTENEVEISLWKRKFLSVLGSNGQIIIDILPRLELIIGHQPAVEEVSSLEAQNRFNQVFENFIRIFCQSYHPLVICLDDLQWADSASLKLIEHIMSDKEIKYLFLTCAYRDDEIDHVHPLKRTVDILKKSIKIKEIYLNSLDIEDITQLISDTIYAGGDYVRELSEMIKKNTEGNPFFIKQYLKTLYDKKLLLFNTDSRCWQWDLNRIKEIVTENVAELMAQKIRNLPSETKEVLLASACLGNTFDLITLSIIYEKTLSEISCSLLPAIEESLILPVSDLEFEDRKNILSKTFYKKYKFLHDRIQQYVHSFTGEYEKKKVNLLTGRQLFHNLSGEELDRRLFEIADHFNTAKELITEEKEKIEFIRLNLMAGKKAKKSIAYREALKYVKQCFEALPDNIWTDYYELAFDLYREGAEIEYFNGHYEESQKLIKFALTGSKTPFEKAELYSLLLVQLTILAEHEEAIHTGIKALSLLGIDLQETEPEQAIDKEISIINNNTGDRSIASLIDMQIMTDAEKKQAVKLLSYMAGPAYYTNKKLFCLIAGKIVSLSLKYGNISESCAGYSMYGMVENSLTGNYKTGYDFNLLAMKLSEKFRAPAQRCIVSNIFGNFIFHWVRPLKEKDTINIEGYRAGLEGGELEFAGYCLCHRGEDYFYSGNKCLKDMLSDITDYIHFAEKTVNKMAISILTCLTIIITNLSGFTKDRLSFDTEEIREEEFMNDCHRNKNHRVLCEYYTLKAQVLYLYGKTHEALTCIIKAKELSEYIWGLFISAEYNFYYSLILADLYDRCDEERKKEYEEEIKINQRQMKIRADNCPENFLHKYLLVEAEIARLRGHTVEAIDYYTMAINLAKEHEFIKDEILARERAGKFWDKRGNKDYAGLHLRKAFYGYSIIGAMSKIEDMKEKYGEYLSEISHKKIPDTEMISPSSSSSELLDLGTVIKASHIISGEIVLENLINKTMVLLIEHSGAQRGFLILENDGILKVEAQIEGDKHRVIESIDLKKCDNISVKIVTYVERTRDTFILNDASRDGNF